MQQNSLLFILGIKQDTSNHICGIRVVNTVLFFRYIMTSEFTLNPTERFFKENSYFGLDPSNVVMFEQRMIPVVTFDGKVILEDKAKIAMAPGMWTHTKFSILTHRLLVCQLLVWYSQANGILTESVGPLRATETNTIIPVVKDKKYLIR